MARVVGFGLRAGSVYSRKCSVLDPIWVEFGGGLSLPSG